MDAVKDTQSQAPVEAGPPPSVALLQLTTGTMVTQAVSVVARLGVADALAGGPKSCEDIAASVDADAPTLYRLLRAVADRGVVIHLDDDRFELTPVGELLRTDVHGSLRAWATMAGLPFHRDAWTDLYASVRTGEPAFARLHGTDLFGYLAGHPDDAAVFDAAMTSLSLSMLAGIVHAYDFGRFSTVVDVGGGRGGLLCAILLANSHLRGVLFDTPSVSAQARQTVERAGVADRCDIAAGDFFSAVPSAGDLYILSNILHDWDDPTAVRILKSCRVAMGGGRLLIVEGVLPDGAAISVAKLVDLEMLVLTPGGRQRTRADFERLLGDAGLRATKVVAATMDVPASYVEAEAI